MFRLRRSADTADTADTADSGSASARRTVGSTAEAPGASTAVTPTAPKGRPTPTRKEAEAAARARAKVPRTRKELAAAQRRTRGEDNQRVRTAMRTGDERNLPPRDQGPVKRFVREYVDSRFSFLEIVLPLVLVATVLSYTGSPTMVQLSSTVMFGVLVLIIVDVITLRIRLRRELAKRFEGDVTKGTTFYAATRSLQMRFMRLPKTGVKIGQQLPERYR